jgi:hypothetical protein
VTNRLQELKETVKKNNDKYKRRTVLPQTAFPKPLPSSRRKIGSYSHLTASNIKFGKN